MDGAVFPQSLWGSEQEKTSGVQGVFGGELQAADGEPAITRDQQVSGVYETGKIESEVRKGTTKNFLENVISDTDYKFLKAQLKADGYDEWHFIVWFMAATGARVSELLHIKAEHVQAGHLDLYSKGGKIRRLYIPKNLRTEATKWLKETGLTSGYIFLNRFGQRITTRGIASQLKHFAEKYGMNKEVVYPHSFRHRFAKNFLDRFNDLALLADLMGHESIETTRIYLRRTASEQQRIVDKVVNW